MKRDNKIIQVMQWALLGGCLLTSIACTRLNRPPTAEEDAMMRETLVETSPRNMNEQPKAVPEFKFNFGGPSTRQHPTRPARMPDEVQESDRDIYLGQE